MIKKSHKKQTSDTLPRSSVAEFRKEAWNLYVNNLFEVLVNRLYFTWCGTGLVIGLLIFSIAGLGHSLHSAWGVLVGTVLAFLIVKRVRRVFGEGAKTRKEVLVLSQEIETLGKEGKIPMVPEGWEKDIHDPLPLPEDKVILRPSMLFG